ncbi:MAG TPA: farnesyl diphosphate synthase [Pyrinomonadaceae bacterium]|jgi:geranylgeranyl pyrophosphate synthase
MKASSEISPSLADEQARSFLSECRALVDERLDKLIPAEDVEPKSVHSAIRWSLFAGGKRLRPALLLATGRTFGTQDALLLDAACALEMVHTYSLIHDDLPAMDDDDLRRGRPTCHIRFGEATAILAGDVLQTLAFQIIAEDEQLAASVRVGVIAELARAAGTPSGMVAGQAYDLAAESHDVTNDELERIHRHKTGALIVAAVRCGALIAGVKPIELEALTRYAEALGLLFQITDDLLDVTATAADLGKTPGKDARSRKATYAALYGLDAARERAEAVYAEACVALDELDTHAPTLLSIADFILKRRA